MLIRQGSFYHADAIFQRYLAAYVITSIDFRRRRKMPHGQLRLAAAHSHATSRSFPRAAPRVECTYRRDTTAIFRDMIAAIGAQG